MLVVLNITVGTFYFRVPTVTQEIRENVQNEFHMFHTGKADNLTKVKYQGKLRECEKIS